MTAEECHERASRCVAQAGLAVSEPVRLEFLKMAGQWRAIAVRSVLLSFDDSFMPAPLAVNAFRAAPTLIGSSLAGRAAD